MYITDEYIITQKTSLKIILGFPKFQQLTVAFHFVSFRFVSSKFKLAACIAAPQKESNCCGLPLRCAALCWVGLGWVALRCVALRCKDSGRCQKIKQRFHSMSHHTTTLLCKRKSCYSLGFQNFVEIPENPHNV